jgi:hypothetical protein
MLLEQAVEQSSYNTAFQYCGHNGDSNTDMRSSVKKQGDGFLVRFHYATWMQYETGEVRAAQKWHERHQCETAEAVDALLQPFDEYKIDGWVAINATSENKAGLA